jgi:hypothetical protein
VSNDKRGSVENAEDWNGGMRDTETPSFLEG